MATMKAWQYSTGRGSLEKNLALEEIPRPAQPNSKQLLVRVASAGLNPADYKLAELGLLSRAIVGLPATPCMDFSGRVAAVGDGVKEHASFRVGDAVFGRADPMRQSGALAEFVLLEDAEPCAALPPGVDADHGAGVATAALTAYQVIAPNVVAGDRVFVNGGAGGTGTFSIQIAKILGCHVTVTCSGPKEALCRRLGADEVIDYTTTDVAEQLKAAGKVFKLAVDCVGSPAGLYKAADDYLMPAGKFVQVAGSASVADVMTTTSRMLVPGFLGGGHRKFELYLTKPSHSDLAQLAKWMGEGKLETVIDEVFGFEDAPKAFEKLKKGRAAGKIIVRVSGELDEA